MGGDTLSAAGGPVPLEFITNVFCESIDYTLPGRGRIRVVCVHTAHGRGNTDAQRTRYLSKRERYNWRCHRYLVCVVPIFTDPVARGTEPRGWVENKSIVGVQFSTPWALSMV
jgi:hypothetical protein